MTFCTFCPLYAILGSFRRRKCSIRALQEVQDGGKDDCKELWENVLKRSHHPKRVPGYIPKRQNR